MTDRIGDWMTQQRDSSQFFRLSQKQLLSVWAKSGGEILNLNFTPQKAASLILHDKRRATHQFWREGSKNWRRYIKSNFLRLRRSRRSTLTTMTSANSNRFCEERVTFDHSECWGRDDRITLFVYFYRNLGCPPKSSWYEIDGAIETTVRQFRIYSYDFIESVFQCIDACMKCNIRYRGFDTCETFDVLVKRMQLLQSITDMTQDQRPDDTHILSRKCK